MHRPQLRQVAQALLRDQVLLIGVGEKRDGGVESQIPAQAGEPTRVEPTGLRQQQGQGHHPTEEIAEQERLQIGSHRFGAAAGLPNPTQQRCFKRSHPAIPGRVGAVIKNVVQMTAQNRRGQRGRRQGQGGQ